MAIPQRFVVLLIALLVLFGFAATAQNRAAHGQHWVDSLYAQLSPEERIGQLFMVAAYSGGKNYNEPAIRQLINNGQIGGLIFMQGNAESQARLTNSYQQSSRVPLLIGMDAEWGLGMRLTGVRDFPRQMMIGAATDSLLMYQMGAAVAAQCRRLGVHVNFAPVVDVNNNPDNPVINARSFGEDKRLVSRLGIAYMHGLQQNGVMACAKHFPGHGDTDTDSHKDLPVIRKSLRQLDTLELYPFRKLIQAGVQSVMVAHLEVPALEERKSLPTTLSRNTITHVLKKEMGFNGLVFTDALNMQGVAKYFQPGDVDLRAFMAGNDVLLFSQDVPVAIAKIKTALDSGKITTAYLEQAVKKILSAKYDLGIHRFSPIPVTGVTDALNKDISSIREEVAEKAITLVKDKNRLLAKMIPSDARITYIGVNARESVLFRDLREKKPTLMSDWLPKGSTAALRQKISRSIISSDVAIVAIHNLNFYPSGGNYGLDAQQIAFLKDCASKKNVLFVLMGNPYLTKHFCAAGSVLVGYEDDSLSEHIMAGVLLQEKTASGQMPVTVCPEMIPAPDMPVQTPEPAIAGTDRVLRKTIFVEEAGAVSSKALDELSMFIHRSIAAGAFPGCRVLAAKNGQVFYDESFGYYRYDKQQKVTENTLYDLASVTKIVATTLAVMKLYEQKKIDLFKTTGYYLPWLAGTDKGALSIRNLLLHQAGLKSWIPFYKETLDDTGNTKEGIYASRQDQTYAFQVANRLFIRRDYTDTVWNRIIRSPLENKGRYVYSDLDFMLLAAVVEAVSGESLDVYLDKQFYRPLGLKHLSYQPLNKFSLSDIAPTEDDQLFRKQLIHGYVHDPGAAMLGGVAGHAGLFGTANDVAVLLQMLLNEGSYNGKRYFSRETVQYFTRYHSRISRRGLGFDKPGTDRNSGSPAGDRVSGRAFGHQGFTGTCAWADPATGVVFVFLSNRVYPSADNSQINRLSIRTVVQDYIYESLGIGANKSRPELYRQQIGAQRN